MVMKEKRVYVFIREHLLFIYFFLKIVIMTKEFVHEEFEETPTWAAVVTVLGYAILNALGWLRDFLRHVGFEEKKTARDPNPKVGHQYCSILWFFYRQFSLGFCSTL